MELCFGPACNFIRGFLSYNSSRPDTLDVDKSLTVSQNNQFRGSSISVMIGCPFFRNRPPLAIA